MAKQNPVKIHTKIYIRSLGTKSFSNTQTSLPEFPALPHKSLSLYPPAVV